MATKYFNFNYQITDIPINVNEDGTVEVTLNNATMPFPSLKAFAETFAVNRGVRQDQLKNWDLREHLDEVIFEQKRAKGASLTPEELTGITTALQTAGMTPEEIGRSLAQAVIEGHGVTGTPTLAPDTRPNKDIALETILMESPYHERLLKEALGVDSKIAILATMNTVFPGSTASEDEAYAYLSDLISQALETHMEGLQYTPTLLLTTALKGEIGLTFPDTREDYERSLFASQLSGRTRHTIVAVNFEDALPVTDTLEANTPADMFDRIITIGDTFYGLHLNGTEIIEPEIVEETEEDGE